MSLYLAIIAALGVGLFAKLVKNRGAIFWTLGTFVAILVGEVPLRMILASSDVSEFARAATVTLVIGGVAFLLACGSSRKPPE